MKTLEQVINAMEFESQNNVGEWTELDTDALHYLRKYQDMLKSPGKMVEYLRQASIQRSKDLARERKQKK